ncbi:MMPL family transporter [Nonomuraea sp. NPDC046802]|uniref:MMPL family transporter n=1 Tax=Nonomuraea sp. NPDC046802 TaxID=3154919 RepID=UPI00340C7F42
MRETSTSPPPAARLAAWAIRHATPVISLWVIFGVTAALLLPSLLSAMRPPQARLPGSASAHAAALIERGFPEWGSEQMLLAFSSATLRADDPAYLDAVSVTVRALATRPEVTLVDALPALAGQDPRHLYALVAVTGDTRRHLSGQRQLAEQTVWHASAGDVRVHLAGVTPAFAELVRADEADLRRIELVTAPLVLALLVAGLGVAGAALITLAVAVAAVLAGVGLFAAATPLLPVDSTLLTVTVTVCLGLGVDYAVLIVLRHRHYRAGGRAPVEAATRAAATAGTTVSWCALAVMGTAACLLVIPEPVTRHMAVAVVVAAAVTLAAALTLLPCLLVRCDRVLGWGSLPWHRERGGAGWVRWGRHLTRRPWPYAIGISALLLLAATPALDLHLGIRYDRAALAGTDVGQALAQMERDRLGGATFVALPHPSGGRPVDVAALVERLRADPLVADANSLDNGRDLTLVIVVERAAPDSAEAAALLGRIRGEAARLLPPGQPVHTAGATSLLHDAATIAATSLWQVIALALICSFALLAIMFRSLLIPLKAICMNLLAIGAALGLLALACSLLGTEVNPLIPLLVFTVVFGLSLDYEVFLVHRIAEHYRRTGDHNAAIVEGLRHTARPITLAAAVLATTFAGLLLSHRHDLRQAGFAVAVAVVLDATLIRVALVPALMRLFGHRNWWPATCRLRMPSCVGKSRRFQTIQEE